MASARSKRVPPGLDDKILPDWNGLMIASLAKGARVLDEPKYAQTAARAADFILTKVAKDGRLLRTYRKGEARLRANLGDYAFMTEGLLNLYEATFDMRWLTEARRLADLSIEHFFDEQGAFFFTADDAEELIARSKHPHDGATFIRPRDESAATGDSSMRNDIRRRARVSCGRSSRAKESPTAFERLHSAADLSREGEGDRHHWRAGRRGTSAHARRTIGIYPTRLWCMPPTKWRICPC
jgi:uncharacterized protein YyaL (SSP411 family)